ncbi:MAG TPA: TIGR00303 family protein [Drouetiella sp.]
MKNLDQNFFRAVSEPERINRIASRLSDPCAFYLCLAGTEVSDIEGISAAGLTPELRRLTPSVDAEALVLGHPVSSGKLPVSPIGVVSPVVITRACLRLAGITPQIVDCGSFVSPSVDAINFGMRPARSISTGSAMPLNAVIELFTKGFDYGIKESAKQKTFVISECVPGGTTTALAVLTALGYDARFSLSSSIPTCDHDSRWREVVAGQHAANLDMSQVNPFEILAAFGDPMQPFVTGMTLALSQRHPVILAGGSQMLAVYALCAALAEEYGVDMHSAEVGVVTTKWVAFDASASISSLASQLKAPLAASCPDFLESRHEGLRAYEDGNVKEGVGAGAALALGFIATRQDSRELMSEIDKCYTELVGTSREVSSATSGKSDAISGESDSISGESDSISGESDSISGESDSISGESDSISGESDAISGESDSISRESDAISGEFNSISRESDAISRESGAIGGESDADSHESNTISRESVAVHLELNASCSRADKS